MNKLEILNELRRCVEPHENNWAVWFRGEYIGTIVKAGKNDYRVVRVLATDNHFGQRTNFMAAIACFIESAIRLHQAEFCDALLKQPEFKRLGRGVRLKKKSVWQRVKGWFK